MHQRLMRAVAAGIVVLTVAVASGEERLPVTFGTIVDPDLRDALSTPQVFWRADGRLLFMDRQVAEAGRTFTVLDPTTGARTPACDGAAALASLRSLVPAATGAEVKGLTWPEGWSADGRLGVYVFAGDLYLLDLASSSFRRLTQTTEAEKNPLLSPDAGKLSFVRANNLHVLDLATGKERALTRDGTKTLLNGTLSWVYWEEVMGRRDTAVWWSPDSQALAFLQSDDAGVAEVIQQEYEPATPRLIHQRYAKAGGTNPTVRAGVVELRGKGVRWLDLGRPQPEYVLRIEWLPDGQRLAVQTMPRSQKRVDLLLVDRRTGASRPILNETSKTFVNVHDDLHLVEGGRKLLWASERTGFYRYYLYDLDGTLIRELDTGKAVVRASSGVFWVKGGISAVDEAKHLVYFTATEGVPIAPGLWVTSWDGGAPARLSSERGTHRVSFDTKTHFYVDAFSTARTPPGSWVRSVGGDVVAELTSPTTRVAPYDLQHAQFLTIPAADGFPLPTRMYRPRGFDATKRYPVVIHVYGGPGAPQVLDGWNRDVFYVNMLLDRGFVYASIDNRCATGLSKELEDTVYGRFMAGGEIDDIVAAVRWLKTQPWVDDAHVGVWGWSGGGTLTLQLLTHSTEFAAGIAGAAVTDFRYYDSKISEAFMGLPGEIKDAYVSSAAASHAGKLSGRLLLIHGGLDDNVQPQNAWRFAHELQKAGITFDMMIYPTEKHGVMSRDGRLHLHKTMLEFWERWLK